MTRNDPDTVPAAFPVVGLGASAGGLEALEIFFSHTPPDSGMAFVVVTHLSPDHYSLLPELLARCCTSMPVQVAAEGMLLAPDRVYFNPPDRLLTVAGGRLRLETPPERGSGLPIDAFLLSLAEDRGALAAAVILSGGGSDGASGARAVKEKGGMVLVQDEFSAAYSSMPVNARRTGAADAELPPEKMPAALMEWSRGKGSGTLRRLHRDIEAHLPQIGEILHERMGDGFGAYKINLQARRIERRMAFNRLRKVEDYLRLLREDPEEAKLLARDFLIGVTAFFRDAEAFDALAREVVPTLLRERGSGDQIRVWVAGCATGEEAYSVAILFREGVEGMRSPPAVQIFATDLHAEAVHEARAGFYPENIRSEVSEARLQRFFTREEGRYRVKKELREMVVFAAHNVLRDPPFSQLDLVCCRNLLIYFDPRVQERLFPIFHHALKPGGFLFLGSAESLGGHVDLFAPVDKKWKVFRRKEGARPVARIESFQLSGLSRLLEGQAAGALPKKNDVGAAGEKLLLERHAPPSVLVNEKGEALHFYARTGRYLEQPVGESTLDILKMAHPDLRPALRAALHQAFAEGRVCEFRNLKMRTGAGEERVSLRVEPLQEPAALRGLALVVFQEPFPAPSEPTGGAEGEDASRESLVRHLEEQLQITSDQLEATLRDYERTNEALMSANEELISVNEELQSTNEELETGKEELQALNEELVTVNAELQSKVEELSRLNDDVENLLSSSRIATLFLDREFRVQRFTPAAAELLGLGSEPLAMPVGEVARLLGDERLTGDVRTVLARLDHVEREVAAPDGRPLLLRVLPYRTRSDVIEGVVLTFTDVTRLKKVEEELERQRALAEERARQAEEGERLLEALMENIPEGITVADAPDVTIRMVSRFGREMTGRAPEAIKGIGAEAHPEAWGVCRLDGTPAAVEELPLTRAVRRGEVVRNEELMLQRPDGRRITVLCNAGPIRDRRGRITGGVIAWRDVTEQARARDALRISEERLRLALTAGAMGVWDWDLASDRVQWDVTQFELFGLPSDSAPVPSERIFDLIHPEDRPLILADLGRLRDGQAESYRNEFRVLRPDGTVRWLAARALAIRGEGGGTTRITGVNWDITWQKEAERALAESEERLRLTTESADVGTWDWNVVADRLVFDAVCKRHFGLPATLPASYDAFLAALHPEDRERTDAAVRRTFAEGSEYQAEYRAVHPDGGVRWILARGRAFRGEGGRVERMSGVTLDITDRKRAETALRETAELYRIALAAADLGTWDYDLVRKTVFWDRRCSLLFGTPDRQLAYEDALALMHPEDRARVDDAVRSAIAPDSEGRYETEYRTVWPDGTVHWLLAKGQAFFEGEGRRANRFTGIVMDMTERRRAEEALRASEERLDLALASVRGGYWDLRMDPERPDHIPDAIYLSRGLKAAAGFADAEIPNSSAAWHARMHPEDRAKVREASLAHLEGRVPYYQVEYRLRHKDERWHWMFSIGRLARDEEGRPLRWTGVDFDITEKKELEVELQRAKEAAEAGSRAKSEFLANMSHEIRTPMTVILGALEQLLQGEEPPERRTFLEMADDAAHRLLALIDDILDISRIEARKLAIEREPFDLRLCMEKTLGLFALKARKKGLHLYGETAPEVPALVVGDAGRLGQVLINLVGNAVKFTTRGEVAVTAAPDPAGGIRFTIRDTGTGIPAGKMDQLFRSFSQVDSSRTRRHGGTGLGLAVSKGLVDLMGGSIQAESEEGRGSVFSFTLPLYPPLPGASQPHKEGGVRILLAEDDPMVRDLVELILRRRGWEVLTATCGREALERWRSGGIDLILMDVQMPGLDGLEATRAIREEEKGRGIAPTPILALTAHARREDREQCLSSGMDGCLTKPVTMDRLYRAVEERLGLPSGGR